MGYRIAIHTLGSGNTWLRRYNAAIDALANGDDPSDIDGVECLHGPSTDGADTRLFSIPNGDLSDKCLFVNLPGDDKADAIARHRSVFNELSQGNVPDSSGGKTILTNQGGGGGPCRAYRQIEIRWGPVL